VRRGKSPFKTQPAQPLVDKRIVEDVNLVVVIDELKKRRRQKNQQCDQQQEESERTGPHHVAWDNRVCWDLKQNVILFEFFVFCLAYLAPSKPF
jgi:hypothetical protein